MKLKVVCLNLWHGNLLDEIIEFLRHEDADVVFLQEAYASEDRLLDRKFRTATLLKDVLGYAYSDFATAHREIDYTDGRSESGNLLLSKFPLISHDPVFFDTPYSETYRDVPGEYENCPRNLQHVTADTPAGTIELFNIQGVLDMDGDNYSDKRKQMARTIINEVKDLPRVILAGDTNATPTNQAIIDIEEHLKSVFGKTELQSTFNMRHKDNPGYATAAVDMILVSPDIKVLEKDCPDVDISDHLPLIATLEV